MHLICTTYPVRGGPSIQYPLLSVSCGVTRSSPRTYPSIRLRVRALYVLRALQKTRLSIERLHTTYTALMCRTGVSALAASRRIWPFQTFNSIQSALFPTVAKSDRNVVVSAPTGCGKVSGPRLPPCRPLEERARLAGFQHEGWFWCQCKYLRHHGPSI